jgi:anti-sigma regulatory factor (Ser/Thr protein kinase)
MPVHAGVRPFPEPRDLSIRGALLRLVPVRAAPGVCRASLRTILMGAPPETVDRVELLVSELVTNSVVHAQLDAEETVDLRLKCSPDTIRVEVSDPGPRFTPHVKPRPGEPGRLGFYLVDKLSDRWGVDHLDRGKAVWFEMDL